MMCLFEKTWVSWSLDNIQITLGFLHSCDWESVRLVKCPLGEGLPYLLYHSIGNDFPDDDQWTLVETNK